MRKLLLSVSFLFLFILAACQTPETPGIKITTTLFPYYDIARALATDDMDVSLVLPPGLDPHDFDPSAFQLVSILESDLFIYNSDDFEYWVNNIKTELENQGVKTLEMTSFVTSYVSDDDHDHDHADHDDHDHADHDDHDHDHADHDDHDHADHDDHDHDHADHDDHDHDHADHDDHDHGMFDPHIWTDPLNLIILTSAIRDALIEIAPESADEITANAQAYIDELQAIHIDYSNWMTTRSTNVMMHGGHNAFAYFANRYDVTFVNAYRGFSTDAEPTSGALQEMIQTMTENQVTHLFSEQLISQIVSSTISSETSVVILYVYSMEKFSKEEYDNGITLFEMLRHNLEQLKIGMGPSE